MSETKICPECASNIPQAACVCPVCSERIEGVTCNKCQSMCKATASVCKWCGEKFVQTKSSATPEFTAFETTAEFVPTLLLGGTFLQQSCAFNAEKIVITTPHAFGLAKRTEEVLWNKVTGFQHHSGIIWDRITIETRGQTTNQINFLAKKDAQQIVRILQQLQD